MHLFSMLAKAICACAAATSLTPCTGELPSTPTVVALGPGVWFSAAGCTALVIAKPSGAVVVGATTSEAWFAVARWNGHVLAMPKTACD
jgi:ABC-type thiamin/hydroxymethylpyrimidine transport system permease subunit